MSKYFSARKVYCYSCCLFQVSSKKEAVFRNIVTIMLFGAIGTAISRTVITLGVTQFFKSWTLEPLTWVIILLFDLSGILTVFFCGIVMSHYTWHNVSSKKEAVFRNIVTIMLFGAIGTAISRTVITLGVTQFFKSWTLEPLTWVIILQSVPYLLQQILCAHCRALTSPTLTMDLLFNLLETSLICFSSVPCLVLHTCPHMACLSHSTDREVALMMLMTYLSYMLAEPPVTKQKNRSHFYEYSPSKSSESSEMLEVVWTTEVALTSPTLTMDLLFNLLETSLICFSSVPCLVLHTCPHMACLSHSTDREVALMMLMTYLSYMLAEVPLLDQDSFIEEVAGNENLPRPDSRGFGPFVSSSPTERGPPGLSGA
ncbi:hypothetical protein DY000_02025869 [Brassica cretica]|uniref:Uncharacterized protein n=1 Tax=Brassica cretica TaxID=69181 RepID=A0ABQ7E7Q0_BRACR|nr:hypothetical protein DY000_02025869 [Brassica cretica]